MKPVIANVHNHKHVSPWDALKGTGQGVVVAATGSSSVCNKDG